MGEYYSWVNIDKKEYISPHDFDLGNKLHESSLVGNHLLGALYELLSSDWEGDAIVFLGDQTETEKDNANIVLRRLFLEKQMWGQAGYDMDYVYERYKCISGLFKAAEKEVRFEIDGMIKYNDFEFNCYRVKPDDPYEGLFVRDTTSFRFIINHSKKEFYDIERTKPVYDKDDVLIGRIDPLPILMAFPGTCAEQCTGLWLGDKIEASNELPPKDYKDMSREYY